MDTEMMKVSYITLENKEEYAVIDKIEDENYIYLFLEQVGNSQIAIRKYLKSNQTDTIRKLKNQKELNHAMELFLLKHPEMK